MALLRKFKSMVKQVVESTHNFNGGFWRTLAYALIALVISLMGYYVHLNDIFHSDQERRIRDMEKVLIRIDENVKQLTEYHKKR